MSKVLASLTLLFFMTGCISGIVQSTLYQHSRANSDAKVPEDPPSPMQKIDLKDADGNRTVGWYYEYSQSAPTVIYFHGNASNVKSNYDGMGELLQSYKINFAIFDYPKYGLSTGDLNQNSVVASSQAVFDFMKNKFPRSEMIIWGRSLGCAPATIIAKNNHDAVSKLVLISPWDAFWKMVRYRVSMSEKSCRNAAKGNEWETELHAKDVHMPVLIYHGTKDDVVPFEMGQNLATQFGSNDVSFIPIEGADHNNLLGAEDWENIRRFITN